eukprot:CAMPEP_0170580868 /NCGR_PEP_ID=MMETSP0224-20130122/6736_1 /TAXON_ID=285029 /ORGANISM="Togula jolla, Strain CCCM 725" /LENGTH=87 /DNA_ID=CAMNT_0010903967 /DNA_START=358 /DNA_END=621 /DNA_ORIENTATION=+
MLEAASAKDPEQFAEATKVLSSQSSYLRAVLRTRGADVDRDDEECQRSTGEPHDVQVSVAVGALLNKLRGDPGPRNVMDPTIQASQG